MIFKHTLSKSTFIRSLQCQKSLYLNKHNKKVRDEITEAQQAIFNSGTDFGQLAQTLFPGGRDASPKEYWNFGPAIEQTRQWMEEGVDVIYEAAFQYEGALAAVDILVRTEDGWNAYEIKGSTSVKDVYLQDAAIQYFIMDQNDVPINDIYIGHINNQYLHGENLDIKEFIHLQSVTDDVLSLQTDIPSQIEQAVETLNGTEPEIDIGPHCTSPYPCDFMNHCWSHLPEDSVFELERGGKKSWDLYQQGKWDLLDIPADFPLTENQQIQVDCHRSGEPHIHQENIQTFLDTLHYPLYFMDFETIMPGIPHFKDTRPFQQIPFQYSLHYKATPESDVEHMEFLAEANNTDPRICFIERLLNDTKGPGDILVYNQGFELTRLKEIGETFPDYAESIEALSDRVKDLMVPFQQKDYYTPGMKGSYSIKAVLPELVPKLSYKNLDVQEGGSASRLFLQMVLGDPAIDVESARKGLIDYCKLDTLAMVKILETLEKNVR